MANPIVNTLPEYVDQSSMELKAKSELGARSASLLTVQTDVNGKTDLHMIETSVVFQDGSECGFNAEGEQKITRRQLVAQPLKVNMEYCEKKLLGTFAQHQVRIAAGKESLPFEEKFIGGVVEAVGDGLEIMIWQGDSQNQNGKIEFDGLLKIMNADVPTANKSSFAKGTSAYTAIKAVYNLMPTQVVNKKDARIIVGTNLFRQFIMELVNANLYHYDPANEAETMSYKLPGSNVIVEGVEGLDGASKDYIVGGRLSNMFYGVDLESDKNTFDFWYSKDDRLFKLDIEMCGSTQVAFPDEIILGAITK